jgi:thiol-disulfide isomerase/thioredoxin
MKSLLVLSAVFYWCTVSGAYSQSQGLEIGQHAPEIRLSSPEGDTIALSTLKGKVVLVDFWASWCAPCLEEQPELAVLYRKYKNAVFTNGNGFEIFGVSLDSQRKPWEGSIKRLNIDWPQVSDLKFWSSQVAKTYKIQALPFNVLIDGDGVIVAKDLHGNELEKYINSLVK